MAETQVTPWDQLDIVDEISEDDIKQADVMDQDRQPGTFLCEITESSAVEKNFKEYACYAAALKFRVERVLELNQPVVGEDGKPIKRDGQLVCIIGPVPEGKMGEVNAVYLGSVLSDDVLLPHRLEKPNTKKRRVFVARRIGLIDEKSGALTSQMWADAVGKKVVVKTEWNTWKDKDTGELRRNTKVGWSGYDYASNVEEAEEISEEDFDDI